MKGNWLPKTYFRVNENVTIVSVEVDKNLYTYVKIHHTEYLLPLNFTASTFFIKLILKIYT